MYSPSDITTPCLFTAVTTTATVMGCLGGCRLPRRWSCRGWCCDKIKHPHAFCHYIFSRLTEAKIRYCRSQWLRGLWPLACWDCASESHRGHGCLSVVSVVCRQVKVSGRADHSSSGVLPTVMHRCVWSSNLVNKGALVHCGLLRQIKKTQLLTRAGLWKSSEVNRKFSYSDRLADSSLNALLFLSQIAVIRVLLAWLRYPTTANNNSQN